MKIQLTFQSHRPLVLAASGLVALLLIALWSYGVLASSRRGAVDAAEDLIAAQKSARRIEELRRRPSLAGMQELQHGELSRRIEEAAFLAQVPPEHLVRVWPEASRRIGESTYKEKPTQVLLRGVSLEQLTRLLHHLSASENGLRVKSLRIIAPREGERGGGWTAETTLSYLIFSPPSGAAGQGGEASRKRDF